MVVFSKNYDSYIHLRSCWISFWPLIRPRNLLSGSSARLFSRVRIPLVRLSQCVAGDDQYCVFGLINLIPLSHHVFSFPILGGRNGREGCCLFFRSIFRRPLQVVFTTASLSHIIALFFLSRLLAPLTCATQSRGFFVQIPCAAQLAACAAQLAQPAEQPANLPCRSHGISPRRKNGLQIPWISRVLSADPLNFASSFEEYPTLLQRARPSLESTASQRRSWSSCPESAAECLVQRCRGRFGFDRFRPIRSYFARSSRKVNTLF